MKNIRTPGDIMVSVKDTKVERIKEAEEIRSLPGVENAVVYQKVTAKTLVAGRTQCRYGSERRLFQCPQRTGNTDRGRVAGPCASRHYG